MAISIDNFIGHSLIPVDTWIRRINVHGTASADAKFEVYADDVLLKSVLDDNIYDPFFKDIGKVLYSFTLPRNPGCVKIQIRVLQGTVCIGTSRARYPAKIINAKQEISYGHFYLWQPMQDSKFLVRVNNEHIEDNTVISKAEYLLKAGDIMDYYHLFYKGIPYWILKLDSDKLVTEVDINDGSLSAYDHSDHDEVEIIKQELINQN